MSEISTQRMVGQIEGEFVVFLIGMRVNRWWKIHRWLPVALAMPRMLKELSMHPELGLLGFELAGGLAPVVIQYWRSFEHLEAYAKDSTRAHLPAWRDFNRRIASNGDVGIWHETYRIAPGQYETIYNNMPPFGLGKAGTLTPIRGRAETARGRIEPA